MFIMYIDEAGDTIPLSQSWKKFLALTGCIIDESQKIAIEKLLRKVKKEFYFDEDVEIKSNFLRYANPDLKEHSPLKLHDRWKYDELEAKITDFLKKIPVTLISVVIDKNAFWQKYPAQNPYATAYTFLSERFQKFLEEKWKNGICILDPREWQVIKTNLDKEIDQVHHSLRWNKSSFWNHCPNIIERILFSTSDLTVWIQIADLYCYPVYHIFEYNKKPEDAKTYAKQLRFLVYRGFSPSLSQRVIRGSEETD